MLKATETTNDFLKHWPKYGLVMSERWTTSLVTQMMLDIKANVLMLMSSSKSKL